MAKRPKHNLREKSSPNLATIRRKRYRNRKSHGNLFQKHHEMNLRSNKNSIFPDITNGRCMKFAEGRPLNNNTATPKRRKGLGKKLKKRDTVVVNDETKNIMFKTIDATGDDDVILVNEDNCNEVIYIVDDPTTENGDHCEDSVIVIDEDSVVERVTSQNFEKEDQNKILTVHNNNESPTKSSNTSNYIKSRKGGVLVQIRPSQWDTINNNDRNIASEPNLPNLSPIPAENKKQINIFKMPRLFTSTPARNVLQPGYSVPNLMENLANMQVTTQPSSNTAGTSRRLPKQPVPQPNKEMSNNFEIFGLNYVNIGPIRTTGLRPIFIDGSNIAMGHGHGKFSVEGLKICIDYFKFRGHEVTAIIPMFRKRTDQSTNHNLLKELEREGRVVFTPSRKVNGRNIVPYDDRYIVLLAHVHQGIIVSSDNYRDLLRENPNLLDTIENRILSPTWLKHMLMFPIDPLGRNGPKLDEFLRFPK